MVDAVAGSEGLPEFVDGDASEDADETDSNAPGDGDAGDDPDGDLHVARGEGREVEGENGELDEDNGRGIDDGAGPDGLEVGFDLVHREGLHVATHAVLDDWEVSVD